MSTATRNRPRSPPVVPEASRLQRFLLFALPALALFACVWVTRVFIAADVVALGLRMTGIKSIAAVAVVGGLLPSLPLGFAFGLLVGRPVAKRALAVALAACVIELAFASLTVPWWAFFTWWVLPIECVVVLLVFPVAAGIGAVAFAKTAARVRLRAGATIFGVLTLCALVWPWLQGCMRTGACGAG